MNAKHEPTPLTLIHAHIREVLQLHYMDAKIEQLSNNRAQLRAIAKSDGEEVCLTLIYNPIHDATRATHRHMQGVLARLAETNTPHLPRLRDYMWLSDGSAAVICEPLDGITLASLLEQRETLSVSEALDIAWQLSVALERLHEAGTYHGEITPHDVVLKPTSRAGHYRVMLGSFGLTSSHRWYSGLSGQVRPYASPEVIFRSSPGASADLYSLGVIVYELITGRLPFITPARLSHVWARSSTSLSSLDVDDPRARELDRLMSDLLEFEPFDRPRRTEALQRRLRGLLARGGGSKHERSQAPKSTQERSPSQPVPTTRSERARACRVEDEALIIPWSDREQRIPGVGEIACAGMNGLCVWGQTVEGLVFRIVRGEERVTYVGLVHSDLESIKPIGNGEFAIGISGREVFALTLDPDGELEVTSSERPTRVTHVAGTAPDAPFAIARTGGLIELFELRSGMERPLQTISRMNATVTALCMVPNDYSLGVIYESGRFERILVGRERTKRLSGLKLRRAVAP